MRRILDYLLSSRTTNTQAHRPTRLAMEMLEDRRLMAIAPGRVAPPTLRVDPTLAWIDNNIQDANLRSLARQSQNDDVLSRTEMIGLLNQAALGGVNSTEFGDLNDLLSRPDLLGTPSYVQELAENVVQGDSANALYQGGSVGNLQAGSTATHLNKLTWKWFYGADRPVLPTGEGYTYQYAAGTLFQGGLPSFADVDQGALGDCWFLASLEEVALRSPSLIQNMFIDNGDGTFTVRFFRGGSSNPEYVTVDRYLPVDDDANYTFAFANSSDPYNDPTNILWPALAEKAYAQLNESGWINSNGEDNEYWDLDGGFADRAMDHITGQNAVMIAMPDGAASVLGAAIANDFLAGKMVVFCSDVSGVAANIVPRHCYAMLGYNAATGTFTLGNPWGTDALVNDLPGGTLTLTSNQLFNNFRAVVMINPSVAVTTLDTILHTQQIPEIWPAEILAIIPNIEEEFPVLHNPITIATIRLNVYRGAGDEIAPAIADTHSAAPAKFNSQRECEVLEQLAGEAVFADPGSLGSFTKTGQFAAELLAASDDESPSLAEIDDWFAKLAAA